MADLQDQGVREEMEVPVHLVGREVMAARVALPVPAGMAEMVVAVVPEVTVAPVLPEVQAVTGAMVEQEEV